MPPRSAINLLPEAIRLELDKKLISGGFSDYVKLADWLETQGWKLSKSTVHRYGQAFEDRIEALRLATGQAKALVEASPDDEGATSEALMRLVQEKLFKVLLDFEVTDPSKLNLGGMAKAIAELGRTTIAQKKWQAEVREQVRAEIVAEQSAALSSAVKSGGLTKESADIFRREILGLAT